jgi:hypothetical protein
MLRIQISVTSRKTVVRKKFSKLKMKLFWVLAPCRHVGRRQRFGKTYCIHLQGWSGDARKWRDLYRVRGREGWGSGPIRYQGLVFDVSPKRWHLPTRLHATKTPKNFIIIPTAVNTSNLITSKLFRSYTIRQRRREEIVSFLSVFLSHLAYGQAIPCAPFSGGVTCIAAFSAFMCF